MMNIRLTIGLPVYNGARFLREALDSLCAQTFSDWKLIISDNCSQDETSRIAQEYAARDSRVEYVRQTENIGAIKNFDYLLKRADTPFFMWAACDDAWHESFLEAMVFLLEQRRDADLVFCNVINTDTYGREIHAFPDYSKFDGRFGAMRFLLDPQIRGKANLIYGLYRTDACKKAWAKKPFTEHRASDSSFLAGFLSHSRVAIDARYLFYKRWPRATDVLEHVDVPDFSYPYFHTLPIKDSIYYARELLVATRGTAYYFFVWILIVFGWPLVVFNDRARQLEKIRSIYHKFIARKI